MAKSGYQVRALGLRMVLTMGIMLSFIYLAAHNPVIEKKSRQSLQVLGAPFIQLVGLPGQFFAWLGASVSSKQELLKQNMTLRSKNLLYKANLQQLLTQQNENKTLQKMMQASHKNFARVEVASLLSVASNPYRKLMVLNKGSNDGVFVNQAVLDSKGVVGQVIEVGPMTSVVLLINDSESIIPVKFKKNGERGFLAGDGQRLNLVDIAKTVDVKEGDVLISSGLAQRYPKGYPVGIVESVKKEPGDPFLSISVRPSAGLSSSELFLLVWPSQEQRALYQQFVARYQGKSKH